MVSNKRIAILVAGGPAPGINSVISAATIRAIMEKNEVVGIHDGFKYIMRGDISQHSILNIDNVSRIHFRGGSHIGIARDNPTRDEKHLENTVTSLLRLNVDRLITIGGDDTAYSAKCVEEKADGRIRVVHVPKTIDNDLALPFGLPTFGYQTARHIGVEIVKNIMVDAQTTTRWYIVVSMGRSAGHLGLGIGKAAGATLSIIPEEFAPGKISLMNIVDILAGAIIKRKSYGKQDGVAILAEGLIDRIDPADLEKLSEIERDEHNNVRFAEINFGEILKKLVQKRLEEFNVKSTIVAKNIGYELRCADPIPYDMEYTRDLGYCAADFIINGGNAAMVSVQNGNFVPMYFKDIMDPKTGRTKVRLVDIHSESYHIARNYMLRLNTDDFNDDHELAKFADVCGLSLEEFRKQFYYVLENDQLYSKELARIEAANGSENKSEAKKAD
ncbi:MAG: 6-phosphofructokinase [Bacteroidetes bacterium]|nr:6-phosphofructokinase [Bacteroidota bacterium]MCH8522994.1 6-phosphofructokinase [Balneolales bacterium]